MIIGITLGLVLLFALFYFALDYNVFIRYQKDMEGVRSFDFLMRVNAPTDEVIQNTGGLLKPRYILSAFFLNNLEFATAVGFPIYLLFVVQGVRTLTALFKKQTTKGEIVILARGKRLDYGCFGPRCSPCFQGP